MRLSVIMLIKESIGLMLSLWQSPLLITKIAL